MVLRHFAGILTHLGLVWKKGTNSSQWKGGLHIRYAYVTYTLAYGTHTLLIRYAYVTYTLVYVTHTLLIRYSYVTRTFPYATHTLIKDTLTMSSIARG